jgi:hypothetical protein
MTDVVTEARDAIDPREMVRLLKEFIEGRRDMTRDQLKAVETLLNRRLPTLSAQQVTGDSKLTVEVVKFTKEG